MSDMLEKLLEVEKDAARLLAEAEAEAGRRKADARAVAQKKHTDLLKGKTLEADAAVSEEKARIVAERERLVGDYKKKLAAMPLDVDAFSRAALTFVRKGGA